MIETLSNLPLKKAVGLLARAALSLGYENAASDFEADIQRSILLEVRRKLGIADDDNNPEALEQIASFLDDEADKLQPPLDTVAALERMATRGDLPSDLYEVSVISNVQDVYGRHYDLERDIIETTIKRPDAEKHYGNNFSHLEPAMISVFQRSFRTKWPLRDFTNVVAAKRNGFKLEVHQSWRIYPSRVDVSMAKDPLEMLEKFAHRYGADVEVNGKRGNFFLFAENAGRSDIKHKSNQEFEIMLSHFSQRVPGNTKQSSAIIVAVDLKLYKSALADLRVKREDMVDEFVSDSPKASH